MFHKSRVRFTSLTIALLVVPLIVAGCGGGTPETDIADPGGLEGFSQDGASEPPADNGIGFDMNDSGFDDSGLNNDMNDLDVDPFNPGSF